MADADKSLSGYWTGAYSYPIAQPSVPFNAHLEEVDGVLTGTITEPDTLGFLKTQIGLSTLMGHRDGDHVNFRKTMQNPFRGHVIIYDGVVNAEATRITGHWTIPGNWSGGFEMTRGDLGETDAITRKAEIDA